LAASDFGVSHVSVLARVLALSSIRGLILPTPLMKRGSRTIWLWNDSARNMMERGELFDSRIRKNFAGI